METGQHELLRSSAQVTTTFLSRIVRTIANQTGHAEAWPVVAQASAAASASSRFGAAYGLGTDSIV